jgi:hypothetical protein
MQGEETARNLRRAAGGEDAAAGGKDAVAGFFDTFVFQEILK